MHTIGLYKHDAFNSLYATVHLQACKGFWYEALEDSSAIDALETPIVQTVDMKDTERHPSQTVFSVRPRNMIIQESCLLAL